MGRLASLTRTAAHLLFHDVVRRDGFGKAWRALERSQWFSPDRLAAMQSEKLSALMEHCWRHVPYYRRIFESQGLRPQEIGDPTSLRRLPYLTKQLYRSNFRELRSTVHPDRLVKRSGTSGSTGESLFFLVDLERNSERVAALCRHTGWCGLPPFPREAWLWGATFEPKPVAGAWNALRFSLHPMLMLSSHDLSQAVMAQHARRLAAYGPELFHSFSTPLERFASFCLENRIHLPTLGAIVASAEQLHEHQKQVAEAAFGTKVFNRYGSREFGAIAHDCEQQAGLHINAERLILEVLRPDGSSCAPGEMGEIVITDLDNYAAPFVRYRIGDRGCLGDRPCPCGRGLPLLGALDGRLLDIVMTPSGTAVGGTFWLILVRHVTKKVVGIQVVQDAVDHVLIKLVMQDELLLDEQVRTLRREAAKVAPDLKIGIEYVDSIPTTRSGKRRLVVGLPSRSELEPPPEG
jgi:phenylacetate-CoA ligase